MPRRQPRHQIGCGLRLLGCGLQFGQRVPQSSRGAINQIVGAQSQEHPVFSCAQPVDSTPARGEIGRHFRGLGMRRLLGFPLLLAAALGFSMPADATTVDVDLNNTGFTEVPFNPGCYCNSFSQVYTQVFQTNPSDTYNFGQVTIYPLEVITPDYSQVTGFLSVLW